MEVYYIYCSSCGFESFDCDVVYSRQTSNSDWYYCPDCNEETSDVIVEEDEIED